MSWYKAAADPLVLKAWTDALKKTFPSYVENASIDINREAEGVIFCAHDKVKQPIFMPLTKRMFMTAMFPQPNSRTLVAFFRTPKYEVLHEFLLRSLRAASLDR